MTDPEYKDLARIAVEILAATILFIAERNGDEPEALAEFVLGKMVTGYGPRDPRVQLLRSVIEAIRSSEEEIR